MGGAAATLTEVLNTLLRHVRMGGGREEERGREAMEEEYEALLAAAKVLQGSYFMYYLHCTCTGMYMYCTCTGMYMYSICTVRVQVCTCTVYVLYVYRYVHVQYMYCTCTVYVLASMKIYMCIFHTCSFILLCVCIHVLASHGTS